MRLHELYRSGKPDISIEFFPPKTPEGVEKLLGETIPRLKRFHPAFFSMTYGAGGSTRDLTIELCDRMKNQAQVETTCHLNIIGQSKAETRENLGRIQAAGVYNLLALRGDPPRDQRLPLSDAAPRPSGQRLPLSDAAPRPSGQPDFKPHPDGFTSSVELIEEARRIRSEESGEPWFAIAVTGFPEVHPEAKDRASDIAFLKRKIQAGGCVVITQLFLDNAYFFEFMEHVRKAGITAPVVPGILPILSVAQLRRFAALCGAKIPPKIERELAKYENDEEGAVQYGIELSTRMCEELLKSGVPGLHFYALNRFRSTEAIIANLGLLLSRG